MKFRVSVFGLSSPDPGTGDAVSHLLTNVDADISIGIFLGAFRAAAMLSGLTVPAPITAVNEFINDVPDSEPVESPQGSLPLSSWVGGL